MDEHAEVGNSCFTNTDCNHSTFIIFHKLSTSLPRTESMEDILPTNNCPDVPEDQEEMRNTQILGQDQMGLPNEEIAIFPQQGEPQAEVDAFSHPMEATSAHLDAGEGPRTPSPTAEEEDGSEGFKSSPPSIHRDDFEESNESPKFPESPFEEPNQEQRDQDEFAEQARFAEEAYWEHRQEDQEPEHTPWTEENEYWHEGPSPARNSTSFADAWRQDTPDPRNIPSDRSASRLIKSTQRLYHRHSAAVQVPVYIFSSTICVKSTDPGFFKHQKFPSTVQQAVAALNRITSYRDAMELLVKASGWNGRRLQDEFDRFLSVIGLGQGLSIPLTVGVTVLTLCGTKAAPKYTAIQDVTQAWLRCETHVLDWLLEQLRKGSTPTELTPDDEIEDTCPGLVRLRHPDKAQREDWYTHYYMCVYRLCLLLHS